MTTHRDAGVDAASQQIRCRAAMDRFGALQKIWKSHNIPISTKIRLMKALVWPEATYGCESWTLRKNEETRRVYVTMISDNSDVYAA